MKFLSVLSTFFLASAVLAAPNASEKAPYGYATQNGGTSGGIGGATTTVSSLAALKTAVADDNARIVWVSGTISGSEAVKVGSNKSILGLPGAALTGVGLAISSKRNIIIRNLKISKVREGYGADAIGIQGATAENIWLDHLELWSDRDHDIDYYDGLVDITHAARYITISWTHFHDHMKTSLISADDSNTEDVAILVTYCYNYWNNLRTRTPALRYGKVHVYNSYFENNSDGIFTNVKGQVLVENNVFVSVTKPLYTSKDKPGYAVARNNDYGGKSVSVPAGSLTSVPYSYSVIANSSLKSSVVGKAGATL